MTRARDVADTQDNVGGSVAPFVAGKNRIINGDFAVNQRNFISLSASGYGFDRWQWITGGGTCSHSTQTFTPGAAPVAGYESRNFARITTSGQSASTDLTIFGQWIEGVQTFAGQTVTLSFWAKATSGTPKIALELVQQFGSGGSPSSEVQNYAGQVTISTSWNRYSVTITLPSIAGKTIGTNANSTTLVPLFWFSGGSAYNARTGSLGIQSNTFDIWGVQLEAGSVATPFTTATGNPASELAACQRYYFRMTTDTSQYLTFGQGAAENSTTLEIQSFLPVTMRVQPNTIDFANLQVQQAPSGALINVSNAVVGVGNGRNLASTKLTVASGLTTGTIYRGLLNGSSSTAFVGWSAEL